MVSVTPVDMLDPLRLPLDALAEGLPDAAQRRVEAAALAARTCYGDRQLGTGEGVWHHALGMALLAAMLRLDTDARIAALLFDVHDSAELPGQDGLQPAGDWAGWLEQSHGVAVRDIVQGLARLNSLRLLTRRTRSAADPESRSQSEVLRKMVLAMVSDIRVVLLRLTSRTQTLRWLAHSPGPLRDDIARESLDIYAPLANRLGVWQLKWELEDLSFRFLEPETYKRIAKMLDERRLEREAFISEAIRSLGEELRKVGVNAEIYGRPKHIYSIYNKMQRKDLDFSQVFDIRALRVLVDSERECYTVLGVVHQLWQPIMQEFDDYIRRPKGNDYRSLHTAVLAGDGRALEVQIRTHDMHRHAELGVAAHWRYKEGADHGGDYDEKIALLRSLLSWRDEIADSSEWIRHYKRVELDDTIYVMTPQGRVIDLPRGATPIDFAYRLHTSLGHRCRGAKIDGVLQPLNTVLDNGQTVEITTAREGGPSRDWLDPRQGYAVTSRARTKIRQFFSHQQDHEVLQRGRSIVQRELQRDGMSQISIDVLAGALGLRDAEVLYLGCGRGEITPAAIQRALHLTLEAQQAAEDAPEIVVSRSRAGDTRDRILVEGVGSLMTTLSRCCKPAPPDAIAGFVTRGRGVSIHRIDCASFKQLQAREPERVTDVSWGEHATGSRDAVYPIDVVIDALDRQGLLRDISEVFSRDKLNVIAVKTQSRKGMARMHFTVEVPDIARLRHALRQLAEIGGVSSARRA